MKSLYDILGVATRASHKEIRAEYKRRANKLHPDKQNGDTEAFQELKHAMDVLGNPERRARYDATGEDSQAPVDSIESLARKRVAAAFTTMIQNDDCDYTQKNIIKLLRGNIEKGIADIKLKQADVRQKEIKLKSLFGLVTLDEGDNLFDMAVEGQVARMAQQIRDIDREIKVAEAANALLERYVCSVVEAAQSVNHHFYARTPTGTTSW